MKILHDIKTAIEVTATLRQARKAGKEVVIQKYLSVPVCRLSYWGATAEFCLLKGEAEKAVRAVFDSFDEETQHALTFAPEAGEWPERLRFWQKALRPALPPKLYHEVMEKFYSWAIRCARARLEAA
ncbi:MAG: hypothetical protein K2P20_02400 [Oscillospiraceae bacterium]|nr:hypothetical protein [Oscillospiraceae bacterium]